MTLWTAEDAARATKGTAQGDWTVSGVSIDTRTLQQGDLFVALKAARDGHDFVAQALENGAAAALVSRIPDGVPADAPLLIVEDVLTGLEDLGRAARARTDAKVVAVTGSVGKTSTKEMLRAVLREQGRTHVAEASYNNHWGVPLTLARMPQDSAFAVIEIGMIHPGDIAPLAQMARPHVAMITTVAPAHMEAFESLDGIAHEKASILDGLEQGGIAILNGDLDTTPILTAKADEVGAQAVMFGHKGADFQLTDVELRDGSTDCRAKVGDETVEFAISSAGRHFAMNGLGVLAAVDALGADFWQAARDMILWQPPAGRGTREELAFQNGTIALIDDAFNANPTSMAASLEVLAATNAPRKVAILGDMLELGASEVQDHAGIADLPFVKNLSLIHCVGPRMRALHDALPADLKGQWFETAPEAIDQIDALIQPGDIVLIKGSKGIEVSLIVDALRKIGHPATKVQEAE
jgi:UDP-N-acetylmuramoyl-tripeptide--D-alanyl-D-alanine ligase